MNNWYSHKIINQLVQDPTSAEGIAILNHIKKIPLVYMYHSEDYSFINDSNDIAACLDYYWSEANIAVPVKNWDYFYEDKNK